jgi:hypothetical protein
MSNAVPWSTLVRKNGSPTAAAGEHEHRVGRPGTAGVDAGLLRRAHRRSDAIEILGAEQAVLARMRVQAGHRDARPLDAEPAQRAVREPDDRELPLARHPLDRLLERNVRADVHHAQVLAQEHHRVVADVAQLGEELRVTGIGVSRAVHRLLVERRGGDGMDVVREGKLDGPPDVSVRRVAGARVERTERQVVGEV